MRSRRGYWRGGLLTLVSGEILLQQTGCAVDLQLLAAQFVSGVISSVVNQYITTAISSWLGLSTMTTGLPMTGF